MNRRIIGFAAIMLLLVLSMVGCGKQELSRIEKQVEKIKNGSQYKVVESGTYEDVKWEITDKNILVLSEIDGTDTDYVEKIWNSDEQIVAAYVKQLNATGDFTLFRNLSNAVYIDIDNLDSSEMEFSASLFYGCKSLKKIQGIEKLDMHNVTNACYMFANCESLESLDLSHWDMSNVERIDKMFEGCNQLRDLNVSGWNTSHFTTLEETFYGCASLTNLDINSWDVSNVSNMERVFGGCRKLQTLQIDQWNTCNVTTFQSLFSYCVELKELDLSNWNVSNVVDFRDMFDVCDAITYINLSNWTLNAEANIGSIFDGLEAAEVIDLSGWVLDENTEYDLDFTWGCSALKTLYVSKMVSVREELKVNDSVEVIITE